MKTFIYIVIMLIDMRNLRKILSIYKKEIILAPLFKLAEAALELVIPIIVADVIDRGVNGKDVSAVYGGVSLMLVLAAVGLGFSIAGQYFSARAATGFSHDVRSRLYSSFLSRSAAYTDKIGVSAMVTRMTSDLDRMQSGVNLTLRLLLRSPLVVFGAFIAAAIINFRISLVVLSAIIVLFVVVGIIMRASAKRYYSAQQKLDDAVELTKDCTGTTACFCFNYGGELELVDAFKKMQEDGSEITAENIRNHLYHPEVPNCDLIVRTSGEQRISGFMLWRAAYSEFLFMDKYFPGLEPSDMDCMLEEYSKRQRRFGK